MKILKDILFTRELYDEYEFFEIKYEKNNKYYKSVIYNYQNKKDVYFISNVEKINEEYLYSENDIDDINDELSVYLIFIKNIFIGLIDDVYEDLDGHYNLYYRYVYIDNLVERIHNIDKKIKQIEDTYEFIEAYENFEELVVDENKKQIIEQYNSLINQSNQIAYNIKKIYDLN